MINANAQGVRDTRAEPLMAIARCRSNAHARPTAPRAAEIPRLCGEHWSQGRSGIRNLSATRDREEEEEEELAPYNRRRENRKESRGMKARGREE